MTAFSTTTACHTRYYPNYFVHTNASIRTYYAADVIDLIEVSKHVYMERGLCEQTAVMMATAWYVFVTLWNITALTEHQGHPLQTALAYTILETQMLHCYQLAGRRHSPLLLKMCGTGSTSTVSYKMQSVTGTFSKFPTGFQISTESTLPFTRPTSCGLDIHNHIGITYVTNVVGLIKAMAMGSVREFTISSPENVC